MAPETELTRMRKIYYSKASNAADLGRSTFKMHTMSGLFSAMCGIVVALGMAVLTRTRIEDHRRLLNRVEKIPG